MPVDLLSKCFTLVFVSVTNSVHHQVQRRVRSVTQELSAGSNSGFEALEVGCELFAAALFQRQLFLHCFCRGVENRQGVDGVRILKFLANITLDPGQVVLQYPRVILAKREFFQRVEEVLSRRLRQHCLVRAIGRRQVKRVLITNGRCIPIGIEQGRQYAACGFGGIRSCCGLAVMKTAEHVDHACAVAGLRFAHVSLVLFLFRYGIHHVGPLGNRYWL